jgi:hypothetical protein
MKANFLQQNQTNHTQNMAIDRLRGKNINLLGASKVLGID